MSQNTNKLTSMIKQAPGQVEGLLDNVNAVTDEIASLAEQKAAFQDGVCGGTKADTIDLLENTLLPFFHGDYVYYGPTFGIISFGDPTVPELPGNLIDWAIMKELPILPDVPLYVYHAGDYPQLDIWVADYSFGNDYITKPLTDGATYGFNANIATLTEGKSILENNAAKVNASMDVMSRYAT